MKKQIVLDFQKAINGLLADPSRLAKMSKAAIKRGRGYIWDCTADKIRDIYYRTLSMTHLHDTLDLPDSQLCQTHEPGAILI